MDWISDWIARRFPSHQLVAVIPGTYGLVGILEATRKDVSPERFALKTHNPDEELHRRKGVDVAALFAREIDVWLRLPPHLNVVPALGPELAEPSPPALGSTPLVRMPYCQGAGKPGQPGDG